MVNGKVRVKCWAVGGETECALLDRPLDLIHDLSKCCEELSRDRGKGRNLRVVAGSVQGECGWILETKTWLERL
jgi:hypothetical protein